MAFRENAFKYCCVFFLSTIVITIICGIAIFPILLSNPPLTISDWQNVYRSDIKVEYNTNLAQGS